LSVSYPINPFLRLRYDSSTGLIAGEVEQPTSKPKENTHVANESSKAYKVVLVGESESRLIKANDVFTDEDRVKFTGPVEGHSNFSGREEVVASFLSSNVIEYGLVPLPETPVVGRNTYRITFTDDTVVDVVADKVLYTQGSEKETGQFTLVTVIKHDHRTEYVVGEALVRTIERVTDGTSTVVPTQSKGADSETASA